MRRALVRFAPPSRLVAHALLLTIATLAGACVAPGTAEVFRQAHSGFVARATTTPPVSLTGAWLPEGTIHKEPGEFDIGQVLLEATLPVPQSRDSFLVAGVVSGARHYDFDGVPVLEDDTLHRHGLRIGYGAFLDDDTVLQAYWQPTIYSDLDGSFDSDDYRLTYGRFLAVKRVSADFFWKLGVVATDAVDTGALPLVGFTWHIAPHWIFESLLPRDITLAYSIDDWLVTTGFLLDAEEYHVRSQPELGLDHYVHVQELVAHLTVERHLGAGLSALVRVGSTLAGNYDYGYGSGTDALSGTLEAGWFASAGLTFRF
jgi:hypothetical protein